MFWAILGSHDFPFTVTLRSVSHFHKPMSLQLATPKGPRQFCQSLSSQCKSLSFQQVPSHW